ncbi:GAF domain-containing protein [Streptomyces caniscabiei]|uniref:GAF domain-containing protein n=1 Tax=Streptomyces caniscabiei TaxID=2746961 RepID=UPI003AF32BC8
MTTAEHLPVAPALASLRRARESFLEGRRLPDGVPEEIVAAWRRARFFGVRHDGVRPEEEHPGRVRAGDRCRDGERADVSDLLAAARPVLERLAPAVGTGRTALLLTDERLRVLWATGRAPGDPCREDLSEQVVGHNSAALALRTRRRAEVHGPEHFLDQWQDMSAVSVPVLGPETGRTVGTVTVTSELCAECAPHPWASLAEAAAAAVEAELLARSRPAERVLLDAYLRAARERGQAVVALDGRNRLVSEAAGRLLSPEGLEALERGVVALLRDLEGGAAAVSRRGSLRGVKAWAGAGRSVTRTGCGFRRASGVPRPSCRWRTAGRSSARWPYWRRFAATPRTRSGGVSWRWPGVPCRGGTRSVAPPSWPGHRSRCCWWANAAPGRPRSPTNSPPNSRWSTRPRANSVR